MSPLKEPNFFLQEVGPLYGNILHFKKEKEYLSLFRPKKNVSAVGESSVSYLYDSQAPSRIHDKVPDARILILLRDPIERAYSQFLHHLHFGFDSTFDFFEAVKSDYNKEKKGIGYAYLYVESGMYSGQVQRYLELFGRANVKILIYEDEFVSNTQKTVQEVVSFLGLNSAVTDEVVSGVYNTSSDSASGMFLTPRDRAIPNLYHLVKFMRRNNLFVTNVTSPITSALWKKFLIKKQRKPSLSEEAFRFLNDIYKDDVK